MQAECKHKKIIFILPFLLLFFCGLQDYTYSPFVSFFKFTCVEFQVRIMLHFAYSIFYIKSHTISVVKCNDIALNSCVVLLSFFCNWWNGGILLTYILNKINILAEWRQTDRLSTLFNIRHPGTY